jgi:hypothetical protein
MPAYDPLGSYDHQARAPAGPEAGRPDPEEAVTLPQPWAPHRRLEDGKLLAERQFLRDDDSTVAQHRAHEENDRVHDTHWGPKFGLRTVESYGIKQAEPKCVSPCAPMRTEFSEGTGPQGGPRPLGMVGVALPGQDLQATRRFGAGKANPTLATSRSARALRLSRNEGHTPGTGAHRPATVGVLDSLDINVLT